MKKTLCKIGLHKWKIWYENDIITEEYCSRCGEKRSVMVIVKKEYGEPTYKPSVKDKRRKKLAKIKLNGILSKTKKT